MSAWAECDFSYFEDNKGRLRWCLAVGSMKKDKRTPKNGLLKSDKPSEYFTLGPLVRA